MAITKRYAHINHAANATQNKLDAADGYITGSLYVGDKASFGNTTALEAILTAGFGGGPVVADIAVEGLVAVGGVLAVMGAAQFEGSGSVGGDFEIDGTLAVHSTSTLTDTVPEAANSFDLGKSNNKWRGIYVQSGSIARLEAQYLNVAVTASVAQLTGSAGAEFLGGNVVVSMGKIETTVGDIIALAGTVSASAALKTDGTLGVHGISTLHGAVIADSTLDVAGNFKVNTDQFIVYAETGNTTINGDLTVNGNVLVDGETFTLDSLQLLVEDKNIILANFTGSGGPTDDTADGGGITISSSLGNKELLWDKSTFTGMAPSFTVNQDWSPSAHLGNSLGQNAQRWQAVYAKTGSFTTVTASAAIKGLTLDVASTSVLHGYAALSGGLGVEGTVSASAAFSGASLDVDGNVDVGGALDVTGNAKMKSELSASSLVVENGATFNGQATFVGGFAVPGQGSFGSLVVGGINMSPISSSSPVSTLDAATGSLLTQALVAGDMAKYEIEIIAADTTKATAAAWKISVAALHNGSEIVATATELLKEKIAGLGALLDVDVEIDGNNLVIKAKGAAAAGTVYWDCQIVKKMVMVAGTGARKY